MIPDQRIGKLLEGDQHRAELVANIRAERPYSLQLLGETEIALLSSLSVGETTRHFADQHSLKYDDAKRMRVEVRDLLGANTLAQTVYMGLYEELIAFTRLDRGLFTSAAPAGERALRLACLGLDLDASARFETVTNQAIRNRRYNLSTRWKTSGIEHSVRRAFEIGSWVTKSGLQSTNA